MGDYFEFGPLAQEMLLISLFDLILYVPSTIFQLRRDGST